MSDERLFRDAAAVELSSKHPEDEAHQSSEEELSEGEEYEKKLLEHQEAPRPDMPMFANSAYVNYNTVGYSLSANNYVRKRGLTCVSISRE